VFNYYFNKKYNLIEGAERGNSQDLNPGVNLDNTDVNLENMDTRSEISIRTQSSDSTIIDNNNNLNYEESSYLYKNNEITKDEAVEQLLLLLSDINHYMICSICKNSLYKTEKCNALSHHNLERCYACGRIGFQVKGLGDHWNASGIAGCYRFDHDSFIRNYVDDYSCNELSCSNHEKGDCCIPEHQKGIATLELIRKKSCVYHALKSLLPELRFDVYDTLYNYLKCNNDLQKLDLLPFKQTLVIIASIKNRSRDYSERVVYKQLNCEYPLNINEYKLDKSFYIDSNLYINKYTIQNESALIPVSRTLIEIEREIEMEIERQNDLMQPIIMGMINDEITQVILPQIPIVLPLQPFNNNELNIVNDYNDHYITNDTSDTDDNDTEPLLYTIRGDYYLLEVASENEASENEASENEASENENV
jgi:hypothetical protein